MAFLRAINLGRVRQFPKQAICAATEQAGFAAVATYINTGNVRFQTRMRSRSRITAALEAAYLADRGFEVPVAVFDLEELREVVADGVGLGARMPEGWEGRSYVSLLRDDPDPEGVSALEARSTDEELVRVRGRAVHLLVEGYGTARTTNTHVERHVGVATNRALSVVEAVVERWG